MSYILNQFVFFRPWMFHHFFFMKRNLFFLNEGLLKIFFKISLFKKVATIILFNLTCFTFLISTSELHLILFIASERLMVRVDDELTINLPLSINCNMWHICFVNSSSFISILATFYSIGTTKVRYREVFSCKQVKYF